MEQTIRIGVFIRGFHNGGIEKIFETYFSHMDLSPYEIHIITHMKNLPEKKQYFENLGCIIHELSPIHGHKLTLRNLREYRALFRDYRFDVVHNNMPDILLPLFFAKKKKVPVRILHAHNIYTAGLEKKNPLLVRLYHLGYSLNTSWATTLVGASKDAAASAFGEKNRGRAVILPNAIETERFRFRPEVREQMRASLGLEEKQLLLGHIGRYENDQKNQEFVLTVMQALLQQKPDARLLMIGDGARLPEFQKMAQDLCISDHVVFTGAVDNVWEYLQAMDLFLLPSRKEGLGIVAVEAQTAGLSCLVSDQVPQEAAVTPNIQFLPIREGIDPWLACILRFSAPDRFAALEQVRQSGYSIADAASMLRSIYLSESNG